MALGIGSVLAGKYRLIGLLGEGGMGCVYEGLHTGTGKRVAVKVLASRLAGDQAQLKRFELEAQAAALINHPGIVDVLDVGSDEGGVPFLVMEHLFGATLRQLERALAPMSPGQVVGLLAPALEALAAAHAAGVIHRDLKPGNIFFALQPSPGVKLLDFGISKFASRGEVTATGVVLGTVAYMAPEQLRSGRNVGPASDLYSVGAVLYALFSGRPPYVAESDPQLVAEILTASPEPLASRRPDLPPDLCGLVDRLLAKEPEQRQASAAGLRQQLLALATPDLAGVPEIAARLAQPYTRLDANGQPATPAEAGTHTALAPATPGGSPASARPTPPPPPAPRRRRWLVAGAGLAICLAAAAAVFTPELRAVRARLIRLVAASLAQEQAAAAAANAPARTEDLARLLDRPLSSGWRPLAPARASPPLQQVDRLPEWLPQVVADTGVLAVASRSIDYARSLREQGKTVEAVAALDSVVAFTRGGQDPIAHGHALRIRGDLALDLKRCGEADDLYRRAFTAFEGAEDPLGAGLVAQDLGLLADVCQSRDGEAWFAVALERRMRAGDALGVFKSANSLGSVRVLFGRYEAAIEAYDQAAAAAEQLGDGQLRARAHANLASAWGTVARRQVEFEARWTAQNQPASIEWAQAQQHLAAAAQAARAAGQPAERLCEGVPTSSQGLCTRLLGDLR